MFINKIFVKVEVVEKVDKHLFNMTHWFNIKCSKEFKTELFMLIAAILTYKYEESVVICIKHDKVLVNQHRNKAHLEPCNHEKADTRLFLHVWDAAFAGMKKAMIIGSGTNIVVISL